MLRGVVLKLDEEERVLKSAFQVYKEIIVIAVCELEKYFEVLHIKGSLYLYCIR